MVGGGGGIQTSTWNLQNTSFHFETKKLTVLLWKFTTYSFVQGLITASPHVHRYLTDFESYLALFIAIRVMS